MVSGQTVKRDTTKGITEFELKCFCNDEWTNIYGPLDVRPDGKYNVTLGRGAVCDKCGKYLWVNVQSWEDVMFANDYWVEYLNE